jgi:hypothetical protein
MLVLYRDTASYVGQVRRYLKAFGREQLHVVVLDDMQSDIAGTYRAALRFLGVDPDYGPDFRIVNPSPRPPMASEVRRRLRRQFRPDVERAAEPLGGPRPHPLVPGVTGGGGDPRYNSPMLERLGQVVFSVRDARYDWVDVVLAAHVRGDWPALERDIRAGLACLTAAEEDDDGGVDPDAVEAAAAEFRYARDLVSAEETEGWLAARHVTVEAWSGYIERTVLRASRAAELDELMEAHPPADEAVAALLWVDGICSGRLAQFAHALAARAAIRDRMGLAAAAADVEAGIGREPRRIAPRGLGGVPPETCRARLPALERLEAVFQRFRAEAVTPEAVRSQLAARRLDWVRLDYRYLAFGDEQAAREALLSLKEDGLGLEQVAAAAKVEVQEAHLYLEQVDPAARARLLAAGPGDVVGPWPLGDGFAALVVASKAFPSEADPEARRRAEVAVLTALVEREIGDRVRWHVPR